MRPRTLTALAAVGLAVAAPVALAGQQSTTIGTGKKTCVLKPGADCRGVVHPWRVEHHGNLRKAKFTKADLRGADFRAADLRRADFRGARVDHADFRDANLKGARFDVLNPAGQGANGLGQICPPDCDGIDFGGDSTRRVFRFTTFVGANLDGVNFTGGIFMLVDFTNASFVGTTFLRATFDTVNFTGARWSNTTCPNGTVTNTGC